MNSELVSLLTELGKENGSNFFLNRIIFRSLFSKYYDDNNNEHRLLLKIANSGYIARIAKYHNSNEKKETIINTLYEDESIDKYIAADYVEKISKIIENVIIYEKEQEEKNRKTAEEKAKNEKNKEKQHLEKIISNSLENIIKYKGLDTLNNYDYCRAYMKDMANGDYIDQITSISVMLENNIHGIIMKKRLFKNNKADLIKNIKKNYQNINDDDNLLLSVLIEVINSSSKGKGEKKWINNLFKFSSK